MCKKAGADLVRTITSFILKGKVFKSHLGATHAAKAELVSCIMSQSAMEVSLGWSWGRGGDS